MSSIAAASVRRARAAAILAVLLAASSAHADPYSTVRSFEGGPADASFSFYRMAYAGSKLYGLGFDGLFSTNLDGTNVQLLHDFQGGLNDGDVPSGNLQTDGTSIYGATVIGGVADGGVVFGIDLDGSNYRLISSVQPIAGGYNPLGGVTLRGATLYGTTYSGGGMGNFGTVFSVNTDGTNGQRLLSFTGQMGSRPEAPLINSGGVLYGTTAQPAVEANQGTMFRIEAGGGVSVVHEFTAGGSQSRLLAVAGSTVLGRGLTDYFVLQTNGTGFHTVPSPPSDDLVTLGNKVYGTTPTGGAHNAGTVFSMNIDGTALQVLHDFGNTPEDGVTPHSGLTLVGNTLYGTTRFGGLFNEGTVFTLTVPEPGSMTLAAAGAAACIVAAFLRRRR